MHAVFATRRDPTNGWYRLSRPTQCVKDTGAEAAIPDKARRLRAHAWGVFTLSATLVYLSITVSLAADNSPRLGRVVEVQPDALLIEYDDAPGAQPESVPLTGQGGRSDWAAGMPVRVWSGTAARAGTRIQPTGATGGFDRTGVRRRLSRGTEGRGRAGPGSGRGGRGGR